MEIGISRFYVFLHLYPKSILSKYIKNGFLQFLSIHVHNTWWCDDYVNFTNISVEFADFILV